MAGISYSGLVTQIRNYTEVDSNVLSSYFLTRHFSLIDKTTFKKIH